MDELDLIIKTHDTWASRIIIALSCAYQDSNHGKETHIQYVERKNKYVQYMLDKMIEEHTQKYIENTF